MHGDKIAYSKIALGVLDILDKKLPDGDLRFNLSSSSLDRHSTGGGSSLSTSRSGTFTADQEAADPTGIHPLRDTAAPIGPTRGITPSPGTAFLAARAARGVTTVR